MARGIGAIDFNHHPWQDHYDMNNLIEFRESIYKIQMTWFQRSDKHIYSKRRNFCYKLHIS